MAIQQQKTNVEVSCTLRNKSLTRAHCTTKVLVRSDPSVVVVANYERMQRALAASIGVAEKWTTKEKVLWLPWLPSLCCVVSDAGGNKDS